MSLWLKRGYSLRVMPFALSNLGIAWWLNVALISSNHAPIAVANSEVLLLLSENVYCYLVRMTLLFHVPVG